jgi:hypothetical protein
MKWVLLGVGIALIASVAIIFAVKWRKVCLGSFDFHNFTIYFVEQYKR